MTLPTIHLIQEDERERTMATAMLAFAADPMIRWFFADPDAYLDAYDAFNAFCGGAIDTGSAFRTEGFEGVALWHPPGRGPDEEVFLTALQRLARPETLELALGVFGLMEEHHPEEECWYLPLIGVDPVHQGLGIGAALMKHMLKAVDEAGLPAYLESSNVRNIPLYERHGFEVTGRIQVEDSPIMTPMYRAAR